MKSRILTMGLFLLGISFVLQAQENKQTYVDDLACKDISRFSTFDFMNMDINLLCFLPTIKDYENPITQFKKGNRNTFRYVDSLDIQKPTKDSLQITVYTQNYVYASQNTYMGGKTKGNTITFYHISLNQAMKINVSDVETFRKTDYDLSISEKMVDSELPIRRVVFSKKYH